MITQGSKRILYWILCIALTLNSTFCSIPSEKEAEEEILSINPLTSESNPSQIQSQTSLIPSGLSTTQYPTALTSSIKDLPDRCIVKAELGPCKHYVHKWAFNKTEGKCNTFIYGGCLGNDNRFNSELECLHVCVGGPDRKFINNLNFNYH